MFSASPVPHAPLHLHPRAFLLYSLCTGWYVRRRSPPGNTGVDEPGPCPSPGRESSARGQPPAAAPMLTTGSEEPGPSAKHCSMGPALPQPQPCSKGFLRRHGCRLLCFGSATKEMQRQKVLLLRLP